MFFSQINCFYYYIKHEIFGVQNSLSKENNWEKRVLTSQSISSDRMQDANNIQWKIIPDLFVKKQKNYKKWNEYYSMKLISMISMAISVGGIKKFYWNNLKGL